MIASIGRVLAAAGYSLLVLGRSTIAEELQYKNARVVHNVLSEDAIASLADQVSNNRFLRGDRDGTNRQYGKANVPVDVLQRILQSIDDECTVHEPTKLRSTLITGDTAPHKDRKAETGGDFGNIVDVMFVFLDSNPGAYFQIGEDKIPATAGTLISFEGHGVVHNTIVPSRTEVRLLGPIASRETFR